MKQWGDSFDREQPANPKLIPSSVMLLLLLAELWRHRYGISLPEACDLLQRSERQIWRYLAWLEDCGVNVIHLRAPPGHSDAGKAMFQIDPREPFSGFLARATQSMRCGRRAIRPVDKLVEGLPLFQGLESAAIAASA